MSATLPAALLEDLDALPAESRFVDADGLRLHVLDYEGGGRPLLVLPGITSPAVTADFFVRALGGGVRALVLDARGRGLSDRAPDGDYSLGAYVADAVAVVRGLGLDRPAVLGHSMGARVAAALAARHPELAGPVVLVDPPLSGPGRAPYPTTREAFLAQLHEAQAGTDAAGVARHYPGWSERERALRARWLPTCDERAVVASHAGFESEDFFAFWPDVPGTPGFVHGADSPVVTAEGAREARAALPAAQFAVVPRAGHMVPWDNLDGFLSAVRPLIPQSPAPPSTSTRENQGT